MKRGVVTFKPKNAEIKVPQTQANDKERQGEFKMTTFQPKPSCSCQESATVAGNAAALAVMMRMMMMM